jgi:hypothetical protein
MRKRREGEERTKMRGKEKREREEKGKLITRSVREKN